MMRSNGLLMRNVSWNTGSNITAMVFEVRKQILKKPGPMREKMKERQVKTREGIYYGKPISKEGENSFSQSDENSLRKSLLPLFQLHPTRRATFGKLLFYSTIFLFFSLIFLYYAVSFLHDDLHGYCTTITRWRKKTYLIASSLGHSKYKENKKIIYM